MHVFIALPDIQYSMHCSRHGSSRILLPVLWMMYAGTSFSINPTRRGSRSSGSPSASPSTTPTSSTRCPTRIKLNVTAVPSSARGSSRSYWTWMTAHLQSEVTACCPTRTSTHPPTHSQSGIDSDSHRPEAVRLFHTLCPWQIKAVPSVFKIISPHSLSMINLPSTVHHRTLYIQ